MASRSAFSLLIFSLVSRSCLIHSATSSTASLGRLLFFSKYPWRLATLNSLSGIASPNCFARPAISSSLSKRIACLEALRLEPGRFFCEASLAASVDEEADKSEVDDAAEADGLQGKKHLKMPSACHLVALAKFTHTSIRPGRLRAGSRRSMWFVVAKRSL